MDLILDINVWIYPVDLGDKFRLVLASSLRYTILSLSESLFHFLSLSLSRFNNNILIDQSGV